MEGTPVLVGGTWDTDERKLLASLLPTANLLFLANGPSPEAISSCKIIMATSWKEVAPLIPSMPNLSFVQSFLAGVERIPREGIPHDVILATGAGSNAQSVAEHAMALLFSLAKNICFHDRKARSGEFSQLEAQSTDLTGRKALILGYGHIGWRIGMMCGALGMDVTAMNRSGTSDAPRTITAERLAHELPHADAIFVALAHTKETTRLIGARELGAMKDNAMLINISRGPIIDQEALYNRLESTPAFRAGLDVWWSYPKRGAPWRQEHPFENLQNVVMTPHVAGLGETWRKDMITTGAKNVLRYLQGEKIENRVDVDAYLM